jgi:hypothetical protein
MAGWALINRLIGRMDMGVRRLTVARFDRSRSPIRASADFRGLAAVLKIGHAIYLRIDKVRCSLIAITNL